MTSSNIAIAAALIGTLLYTNYSNNLIEYYEHGNEDQHQKSSHHHHHHHHHQHQKSSHHHQHQKSSHHHQHHQHPEQPDFNPCPANILHGGPDCKKHTHQRDLKSGHTNARNVQIKNNIQVHSSMIRHKYEPPKNHRGGDAVYSQLKGVSGCSNHSGVRPGGKSVHYA